MSGIKEKFYLILTGLCTGIINGLFGGGGGMIVVPMLILLLKRETKKAHATALLIILPVCIVSAITYAIFGEVEMPVLIPVGIGVIAGGVGGALLLKKLSSKWIILTFAAVMAAAGVKMLFF